VGPVLELHSIPRRNRSTSNGTSSNHRPIRPATERASPCVNRVHPCVTVPTSVLHASSGPTDDLG
jgi:hypothetical protein